MTSIFCDSGHCCFKRVLLSSEECSVYPSLEEQTLPTSQLCTLDAVVSRGVPFSAEVHSQADVYTFQRMFPAHSCSLVPDSSRGGAEESWLCVVVSVWSLLTCLSLQVCPREV